MAELPFIETWTGEKLGREESHEAQQSGLQCPAPGQQG